MEFLTDVREILSEPATAKAVVVIIGAVVIFALRRVLRATVAGRIHDKTTRYRARKLVGLASYVALALLLVSVFSDRLGDFTVALGVAGAGIAFALQEVIVSVAGWLAVSFGNFYKVGDRVMLGGIKGDVIDIGVLRTTLFQLGDWVAGDLYNGRVVRVANSFVFKEPVFNYSAEFPFLWDEITVPIRHGSDRELARRLLEEVAEELTGAYAREVKSTWDTMTRNYVIEAARVEPFVTMTLDANWMTYTMRYVVDFKRRRITKDALYSRILDRIAGSEGAVSLAAAAQEITLVREPAASGR